MGGLIIDQGKNLSKTHTNKDISYILKRFGQLLPDPIRHVEQMSKFGHQMYFLTLGVQTLLIRPSASKANASTLVYETNYIPMDSSS
ncbi:MAG: hypothetical protein U5K69_20700 [Balneolaceae bacterium]|nr:hypothetical protein [Balneolaceae bacterium]